MLAQLTPSPALNHAKLDQIKGSTYYYYPATAECNVIPFPVGILKPDWLQGAKYHGVTDVNGRQCDVWTQGSCLQCGRKPFVTYYADVATAEPVRWVFFDGGFFDVRCGVLLGWWRLAAD